MTAVTQTHEGFVKGSFTSTGRQRHDVYRLGSGPAVLINHEVPVISVSNDFARRGRIPPCSDRKISN
jgi:hypothetical protein